MSGRMRKILESKASQRKRLAALTFAEKVKLLEQLRDRTLAIANSPLKRRQVQHG
jgi:hypothetical protein